MGPNGRSYQDFLTSKRVTIMPVGRTVTDSDIHPLLFPFQRDVVRWAVGKGRCAVLLDTGLGKAVASDTRVVTPTGMQEIRSLKPGDYVVGVDGKPTRVIGVYPQGLRRAFRVTFSDSASVVCDEEHLWAVRSKVQKHRGKGWEVRTLREIVSAGLGDSGAARYGRWFIPTVQPVIFQEGDLPLHPYVLGCLIGDGQIKQGTPGISSADPELIDRLAALLPLDLELKKRRYTKYDYVFARTGRLAGKQGGHHTNPLVEVLSELGLWGHGAESKFIPESYKFSAVDTRIWLLQGLLDTDGGVWDSHGTSVIEFCTVSERLAQDFLFLVQSLGGRGRISTKHTNGRMAYRIHPSFPPGIKPFLLKRKAMCWHDRTKYPPTRSIRSVESVPAVDMTCIKVDAPDGLFVLDNFVVTHNTFAQLEWARLLGERTLILAPLSVARQTVREGRKIDLEVRYVRDQSEVQGEGKLWITNYELLDHFDSTAFGAVVLDECFAPGTQVDTPTGKMYIQDIRPGDQVFNADGIDTVQAVHQREVPYAIRITVYGRSIVSSPNHPYFTQRGWVNVQDLQPGDALIQTSEAMRMVREGLHPPYQPGGASEAILRSILLGEMEDEATRDSGEGTQPRGCSQAWREKKGLVRSRQSQSRDRAGADTLAQPDGTPRSAQEGIPDSEGNAPWPPRAWWQWEGLDAAPADSTGCHWADLAGGVYCATGATDSRLPQPLQARPGESRATDWHRGGWELPLQPQGIGYEEGCQVSFAWVDRVEVLEPGHPDLESLRDADGKLYFYDLSCTRHPSYSVNSFLVHNSSILKALSGITRAKLAAMFAGTRYRLCCTATPAPNDHTELGNHAHFLGICTTAEMLATFFINANRQQAIVVGDRIYERKGSNKGGQEWRLKHHAEQSFFRWLASWAICMTKPSDLGYEDDGFILPELRISKHVVSSDYIPSDQLVFTGLRGLANRADVRRHGLAQRLDMLHDLVNGITDQWIVWVGLDQESREVTALFPDAVEIKGSDPPEHKAQAIENFQDGKTRVMVTKARIGGYGLNLQGSHRQVFFGLGDSWEQYYQCIRRQWRYGQQHPVEVHLLVSEAEEEIYQNIQRKDALATRLRTGLIEAMQGYEREELGLMADRLEEPYQEAEMIGRGWRMMLGDSCKRLAELADNSVDLSIYSPPFIDLFTYSASNRDLGNSRGLQQFLDHYAFIVREVLRVTKPGRLTCVHTSDVPAMASRDGWIGLKDFPGEVIRAHEREGWTFVGRAFVPKNPQSQAVRVKAKALLFTQLRKDSSDSRPALIDQILLFSKSGENVVPIRPVANGEMDNETWIEWANGIWLGISESDTLSVGRARDASDEKHVCPLQLGTIERCLKLYSNPGEVVLDPFAGIGSVGFMAVKLGRGFLGIELKGSYYKVAVDNLRRVEAERYQPTLFDLLDLETGN